MLRMKVNTKLLQQHLGDATGKVVTLKDVRNMQTSIHTQSDKNNLEALVNRLRQIHGKCYHIKLVLVQWSATNVPVISCTVYLHHTIKN